MTLLLHVIALYLGRKKVLENEKKASSSKLLFPTLTVKMKVNEPILLTSSTLIFSGDEN